MLSRAALALAAAVALAAVPAAARPDPAVKVTRAVTYATAGGETLQLDVATPATVGPHPAVVLFHGGAWRFGTRAQLSWVIEALAAKGYVAASASYRLAPKHLLPDQLHDVRSAVRFVRANAKTYGADPDKFAVGGFSAGAHLAMLAAFDPPAGQPLGARCVVDFFGPTDLTLYSKDPDLEDAFMVPFLGKACKTDPEVYRRASPVAFAAKGVPPVLLVHGTADLIVPIVHSEKLHEKLVAAGAEAELVRVPGNGHGPWRAEQAAAGMTATVRFLDRHLKGMR
ncbi:alpha/beta hydrolase [Urbifossiella limnaea]|uniref:Carboxylesterase NlhH n=1 Tax=Urbifossiella limnaea TaxID=2528023 RepID=A0A517XZ59_9BACT|nr:alpha/beta hydrolase [Urbifossiella limnaea]QDU22789.1 Carboxylesterase NlhH [Urbifossiella limnaea]